MESSSMNRRTAGIPIRKEASMALSNTQYDTLMRRYEARQLENQHIVMERINDLYPKFPRLAEIDEPFLPIP